jgi:hypothetical protein
MDEEKLDRIERRLDRIEPIINALGRILIRRRTAVERGVPSGTVDTSTKINRMEEVGHKRVFVEIGEVGVIPQRKRKVRPRR